MKPMKKKKRALQNESDLPLFFLRAKQVVAFSFKASVFLKVFQKNLCCYAGKKINKTLKCTTEHQPKLVQIGLSPKKWRKLICFKINQLLSFGSFYFNQECIFIVFYKNTYLLYFIVSGDYFSMSIISLTQRRRKVVP